MAHRTAVKDGFLIVVKIAYSQHCVGVVRGLKKAVILSGRDDVLVFIVREIDPEFLHASADRETKTRFSAGGSLDVAYRANRRAISGEELLAMAADAGCVVRVVSYIRVITGVTPILGRYLMTCIAALPVLLYTV